MARRHFLNAETQAPLCGQRDRRGRRMLPASQCTTQPDLLTCATCHLLLSKAVTEADPRRTKAEKASA